MHRPILAGMAGAVVIAGSSVGFATSAAAGAPPELARIEKDSLTDQRRPLPTAALQVFTYEGAPRSIHVTREGIAVAYERSGVLFDRASGAVKRRLTVKDGWPENRPPYFAAERHRPKLLGPGVAEDFSNLAGGRDDDNAPV